MALQKVCMFLVITMLISLLKTLSLAYFGPPAGSQPERRLGKSINGSTVLIEAISGSDVQLPFSDEIPLKARYVGAFRILYPVLPGTSIRDMRYHSSLK